jgi:hypothetical protein
MRHTIMTKNPQFEGPLLHGLVHFHAGQALVDDALEVVYDTAEPGGESAALHPVAHNAIALLVAEGCIDMGPIYTQADLAALSGAAPPKRDH